MIRATLVP
jgi:NADH-quinone oxidoreductase subunit H